MNNQNNGLPEGFKMTELGPLPEEWQTTKLSSLLKERVVKNRDHEQLPVYTISNIYGFILSDSFFEKQVYSRDLATYKVIRRGYFAYNPYRVNVGSLGVFLDEGRGLVSPAYVVFEIERPEILDHNYLYLLLKSDRYHELIKKYSMSRGSVRHSLSYKDLAGFEIPLPRLPEQKVIARVLATIQKAIQAQDKIIAASKELKKSLMHYLFTYGPVSISEAEHVPLNETEIGTMPEHWEVVTIGDEVNTTQYGISLRGEQKGKYPILRMNSLIDGRVDDSDLQYVDLEKENFEKFRVKKGDILFNRTNSYELVGKTALFELEGDYVFASYLVKVVTNPSRLFPRHLNYYLNSTNAQDRLRMLATRGVSQSNINATKLRGFRISLPPLSEQQEIARMLSVIDNKIKSEEIRRAALQILFKTVLHQLMSGKVRVKEMEAQVS